MSNTDQGRNSTLARAWGVFVADFNTWLDLLTVVLNHHITCKGPLMDANMVAPPQQGVESRTRIGSSTARNEAVPKSTPCLVWFLCRRDDELDIVLDLLLV